MQTHHVKSLNGESSFTIVEEGVAAEGASLFGPTYKTVVKFDQLDDNVTTFFQRYVLFWWSVFGVPIFGCTAISIVSTTQLSIFDHWPGLLLAFTIISLVVAIITRRSIEFAQFNNKSGFPALIIERSGPNAERHQEFVDTIRSRIKSSQYDE